MKLNLFIPILVLVYLALPLGAADMTVVIEEDFESGVPASANLVRYGGGTDPGIAPEPSGGNALFMTYGENSQLGYCWFDNDFDLATKRVEVEFDLYLGRGASATPADGGSVIFQFDGDMAARGDGGGGNAVMNLRREADGARYEYVAVSFDIWDNGDPDIETGCDGKYGDPSTAHVEVLQNQANVLAQAVSVDYIASADAYGANAIPENLVHIKIIFDNRYMVVLMSGPVGCDGAAFPETEVLSVVTAAFPDRLANIGFGASTGGANSTMAIDNLVIREGDSLVNYVTEAPRTSGAVNMAGPDVDATAEIGKLFVADRDFGQEISRVGDVITGLTITSASMGRVAGQWTNTNANIIDVSGIDGAGEMVADLFETIRYSDTEVRYVAAVEPGRYDVTLYASTDYLASINSMGQANQFFDVYVNNEKVLQNWSAAAAAGSETGSGDPAAICAAIGNKAVAVTFSVDSIEQDGVHYVDLVVDDLGAGMPPEQAVANAMSFERTGDATGEAASGDIDLIGVPDPADPDGVLISADFEDDVEGTCPEGIVCNGNGSFAANVVVKGEGKAFRVMQDTVNNIANTAVFDQTVDVLNYSLTAEFDLYMDWTGTPADGGAFFIRESGNKAILGGAGGALAIPGGANGVVVEFDTWLGGGNNEPSGMNNGGLAYPHVGINNMSTNSVITMVQQDPNLRPVAFGGTGWPAFNDPNGVHVEVIYSAGNVQVYLTGTKADATPFDRTLVAEASVPPIRMAEAVIGFCGGTGGANQTMEVDNVIVTAQAGTPSDPVGDAVQQARDLWAGGAGELYINCGGPLLPCSATQNPAPPATGDADAGAQVVWLQDQAGGAITEWTGEFFSLTALSGNTSMGAAGTDMGNWDARGTSPGVDNNDQIFHSERYGDTQYDIPVIAGTEYELTLYFANSHSGTAGTARRFFHVEVEGERLDGFEHCPTTAPGVDNPLYNGGMQHDDIFDPVGAADQLYIQDAPCDFTGCANNGVLVQNDPDADGILAPEECGNAAAVAIRLSVTSEDDVITVGIMDPDMGRPASPDGNPKISGISIRVAGAPVYTGDANCDSKIDLSDAICVLTYMFGNEGDNCKEPCCLANNDTNDDGKVDLSDAIRVLGYMFTEDALVSPDGDMIRPANQGCGVYQDVTLECANPCN